MTSPNDPRPAFRSRTAQTAAILTTAALVAAGALTTAAPASAADNSYTVAFTGIGIYPRASADMSSPKAGLALSDGTRVTVSCEADGTAVSNGSQTSTIWEQLEDGTWLPNVFVDTGTDGYTPGIARCDSPVPIEPEASTRYDRQAAVAYAREHVHDGRRFLWFSDCTAFASAVLWHGGLPQTADWSDHTTDPDKAFSSKLAWTNPPTKTAMSANRLPSYLEDTGQAMITEISLDDDVVPGATLGDLIAYKWDGPNGPIDHIAVVTDTSGDQTLVTQHETAQLDKGWNWSADRNQWVNVAEPDTVAYLIHITD